VTGVDEKRVREIVDTFRAEGVSFLRPYGEEPITGTDLIDISHEALMRCWQRMADPKDGWLVEELRSDLRWRSLLLQVKDFEGDASNVLPPATTEERAKWLKSRNAAWAERYGGGWERVQALITASQAAAAEVRRLEDERLLAVEQARRFRLLRWGVTFLILLVCIIGFLAWVSWNKAKTAEKEKDEAKSQSELANNLRIDAEKKAKLLEEAIQKLSSYNQQAAKALTAAEQISNVPITQSETTPTSSTKLHQPRPPLRSIACASIFKSRASRSAKRPAS